MKKHRVRLTAEERRHLEVLARTGSPKAQEATRAQVLLASDEHGPALKDQEIALALGLSVQTVEVIRKKYVSQGLSATVQRATQDRLRSRVISQLSPSIQPSPLPLLSVRPPRAPAGPSVAG